MKEQGLDQYREVQFSNDRVDALSPIVCDNVRCVNTTLSAVNMIEVSRITLRSDVKMGVYANALCAVVNLGKTGYVVGSVGVVCAELDMPSTNPVGTAGTYWAFEAEINLPTGYTSAVPVAFFGLNVWGGAVAYFDTYGLLFDISGVTKASGKFFQDNTAGAASQALKCRVNGTLYYVMLTSTGA
jgi:hypothetical protein